jgi:excisionase family DNA binding protein
MEVCLKAISYSVKDVCTLLGLGRTTIYKLLEQGCLTRIKVGSRTLIPAGDVEALLGINPA